MNIVGVSTAICLGGPDACFWMWLMCIIGAASAFIESTLAQVYKIKEKDGTLYGGPAYYIERALLKITRNKRLRARIRYSTQRTSVLIQMK